MFNLDDEEKEVNQEETTNNEGAVEVEATRVESTNTTSTSSDAKSKLVAGLLGIFLGSFGVHNFYLGYTGKAVAQLLITLLTCGFGAFISSVWGLIEGILILAGNISVDGNGNPLKD